MSRISATSIDIQWRHYVPTMVVLAGITYLSLIKQVPAIIMDAPLTDKWGHMLAYLVLALCLGADSMRSELPQAAMYLIALILPIAYGGLMELLQMLCPPRMAEWTDWLADSIGAVAGILLIAVYDLVLIRRKKRPS